MNLKLFFHSRKTMKALYDLIPGFVKAITNTGCHHRQMRACKACASFIGEGVYCGRCFNKVDEILPPIWMNNELHFYCETINNKYKKMAYYCNELEYKNRKQLPM